MESRYLAEFWMDERDWPSTIWHRNDDGRTVRAMDVVLPKIGEIIGGS